MPTKGSELLFAAVQQYQCHVVDSIGPQLPLDLPLENGGFRTQSGRLLAQVTCRLCAICCHQHASLFPQTTSQFWHIEIPVEWPFIELQVASLISINAATLHKR